MQFKMLNNKVGEIVEKLGKAAPGVTSMKDVKLQELNEAINNTIDDIKKELHTVQGALSEVIKVVEGEISRRGIKNKVDNQISMFDNTKQLGSKIRRNYE